MKLFHTERGKEVVYVQLHDIMYLFHETDIPLPASIFTEIFVDKPFVVCDSNRFDFLRFKNEKEVQFFKELDFIIDFDQYKNLTDKEFDQKAIEIATKANEIAEKWNSMSKEERGENQALYDDHRNLEYMLNFITEVYAVIHRKRAMCFPKFVKVPYVKTKKVK